MTMKLIVSAVEYLSKLSKRALVVQGSLLALLMGIPDYLLGREIGFSIFYLIPISLTTWFGGPR